MNCKAAYEMAEAEWMNSRKRVREEVQSMLREAEEGGGGREVVGGRGGGGCEPFTAASRRREEAAEVVGACTEGVMKAVAKAATASSAGGGKERDASDEESGEDGERWGEDDTFTVKPVEERVAGAGSRGNCRHELERQHTTTK